MTYVSNRYVSEYRDGDSSLKMKKKKKSYNNIDLITQLYIMCSRKSSEGSYELSCFIVFILQRIKVFNLKLVTVFPKNCLDHFTPYSKNHVI